MFLKSCCAIIKMYVRFREEDIPPLLIERHVLVLSLLEFLQLCRIITLDPTGFIEVDGFPPALRPVLVQQPVLDHLELELTDRPNHLPAIELVGEELGDPLVHQLLYPPCGAALPSWDRRSRCT